MLFDAVAKSFDAMWLLCVASCHVMHCHVMVMSCYVLCPATGWNVMSLRCHWFKVWRCGGPKNCSVLQSTTQVLLRTTKYYSSTTPYYKVLLQNYSVLQSTTPVLQSTTPVLLCTTKYYASTTLYYKVLHQYYKVLRQHYKVLLQSTIPVLQSTTPVLLWNVIYNARSNKNHLPISPDSAPATQNECHNWSASHMKHHFQCGEQQESPSNFTKYCACHGKWM